MKIMLHTYLYLELCLLQNLVVPFKNIAHDHSNKAGFNVLGFYFKLLLRFGARVYWDISAAAFWLEINLYYFYEGLANHYKL